jgi:hypothetical protein
VQSLQPAPAHATPTDEPLFRGDEPNIRTIVSVDDSEYHAWQAEWLAWSFDRVQQPGRLTRLWSGDGLPTGAVPDTFQTRSYSPHPITGDAFACYNKPFALDDWLRDTPTSEETILLVDPDFVFVQPVTSVVEPGYPIAQQILYLDVHKYATIVQRHCRVPDEVQSIGLPILINRIDLEVLTPLWVAKTEAIRNDAVVREDAGWLAEMWGYVFAAAEFGIRHEIEDMAAFQIDARVDLPFIHYCYTSESRNRDWRWDKRGFKPGTPVTEPPDDVPPSSQLLISLLNEWLDDRARIGQDGRYVQGHNRSQAVRA